MARDVPTGSTDTADAGRERRDVQTGFPVLPPLIALLEIAFFFVPITLVELLEPTLLDIASWQPHPFWLPVLLLSLQYGTASGLLTAGIAIAVSVLFGFPEQEVGENHFSYLLRIWLQPVLWIAAAVLLGQFRLRQINERNALQEQLDEALAQRQSLASHAEAYRQRCERLERRMASRPPDDARALAEALLDIEAADMHGAATACLDCMAILAPGAETSCYQATPQGLALLMRRGSLPEERVGRLFPPNTALYDAVVREARALDVLRAEDEAVLSGAGLVAVPIVAPSGSSVLGMLKIDLAPGEALSADLADQIAVVARHAGHAFAAQAAHANTQTGADVAFNVRSRRRQRRAWKRAARSSVPERATAARPPAPQPRSPA